MAQEGARKSRAVGEGQGKWGRSQAAEPVMGPLATGSWWLMAGAGTEPRLPTCSQRLNNSLQVSATPIPTPNQPWRHPLSKEGRGQCACIYWESRELQKLPLSHLLPRSPHTYLQPEGRGSRVGGSGHGGVEKGRLPSFLSTPSNHPPHTYTYVQAHAHTHPLHTCDPVDSLS